jgi:hypothetical protein
VEAAGAAAVGCTAEALETPPARQHLPHCTSCRLLLVFRLLLLLLWQLLWVTGPCWCICSCCLGRVFAFAATADVACH